MATPTVYYQIKVFETTVPTHMKFYIQYIPVRKNIYGNTTSVYYLGARESNSSKKRMHGLAL